ncbi:DNA cytosine methyltransferase [Chryseobacterium sp. NEB161]|nr:DNA cytosine methyltransferase [Chryseobacterium sp. NEB161]
MDFGVPQSRERVFFVGICKTLLNANITVQNQLAKWFPFPSNPIYNNAATKYDWGKMDPFGKILEKPNGLPLELCVESCLINPLQINVVPNANEYFNLHKPESELKLIKEGETNRPSFKRLHRFRYSPTACYGNNEVHLHPYEQRRISVREALRIQGVPDNYVLPENLPLSKKFKMIGNGVPVPLAKAVAEAIKNYIGY